MFFKSFICLYHCKSTDKLGDHENLQQTKTVNAIYLFNESKSDALAHLIEHHVVRDGVIVCDNVFGNFDVARNSALAPEKLDRFQNQLFQLLVTIWIPVILKFKEIELLRLVELGSKKIINWSILIGFNIII